MNICTKVFLTKLQQNILQNAPKCTILNFFGGKHSAEPPSKRVTSPRVSQIPPFSKIYLNPPK